MLLLGMFGFTDILAQLLTILSSFFQHNVAVVSSMFAANQAMVRTKSDTLRAVCQELRSAIAPIQVTAWLNSGRLRMACLPALLESSLCIGFGVGFQLVLARYPCADLPRMRVS